jgi:hypothetical protein
VSERVLRWPECGAEIERGVARWRYGAEAGGGEELVQVAVGMCGARMAAGARLLPGAAVLVAVPRARPVGELPEVRALATVRWCSLDGEGEMQSLPVTLLGWQARFGVRRALLRCADEQWARVWRGQLRTIPALSGWEIGVTCAMGEAEAGTRALRAMACRSSALSAEFCAARDAAETEEQNTGGGSLSAPLWALAAGLREVEQ